ncbi:MAG: hypothetical protein NUW01_11610 [Gemmatimonadaceae bacterium]|nr:hypothetical protein [Gemmatimonadaceae bacterium]
MSSGFDPVQSDRLEVTSEAGAALTDFDYRVMASVLKMTHSLRWPKDAISYLAERIGLEGFQIPVSQLSGFSGFIAQASAVATAQATTSTSFTDLATVGPQRTDLAPGQYLVLYGCNAFAGAAGDVAAMGISVNGGAVATKLRTPVLSDYTSLAVVETASLTAGINTVVAKYKSASGATASFADRWLIALKYADN